MWFFALNPCNLLCVLHSWHSQFALAALEKLDNLVWPAVAMLVSEVTPFLVIFPFCFVLFPRLWCCCNVCSHSSRFWKWVGWYVHLRMRFCTLMPTMAVYDVIPMKLTYQAVTRRYMGEIIFHTWKTLTVFQITTCCFLHCFHW